MLANQVLAQDHKDSSTQPPSVLHKWVNQFLLKNPEYRTRAPHSAEDAVKDMDASYYHHLTTSSLFSATCFRAEYKQEDISSWQRQGTGSS